MTGEFNYSSISFSLLALLAGLSLLVAGGEALVAGAVRLACRLGMSALMIGLTVVAFGTSMPELFVSLSAALQDKQDLMLGNVIGSNIANVGLILGICALVAPIGAPYLSFARELYYVLAASFAVAGAAWYGFFPRSLGLLFITALILFTYFSYKNGSIQRSAEELKDDTPASYWRILPLCGGGLIGLSFGSNLLIGGAADVARYLGVSNLIIGLTIAAVGTSLPELASSISAIRKGEPDLLMVMGGTAVIKPFFLQQQQLLQRDLPVMTLFSAVLLPFLYLGNQVSRLYGFLLLVAYGLYIFSLKAS
ncbi:MAG: sodium:calcium antiporter [Proteobacteria bacterium]|nr:sodium:calcium antiporter [Pseudomonadota bacterium]MBU4295784.1 sodium:calcium antiporter [Pseudomonadota bacterium]MCG2747809.1 sodium:calcium antiporter [Desulfobulbaceae bacterium]